MNAIYKFLLAVVSLLMTISCISDALTENQPSDNLINIRFSVSDFPDYNNRTTRAVGIQDEGKSSWENDDLILVCMTSEHFGAQVTSLIYNNGNWIQTDEKCLSYMADETPSVTAIYAPDYEVDEATGEFVIKSGILPGMDEYLNAVCTLKKNILEVNFNSDSRDYSRLRIAVAPETNITVEAGNTISGTSFVPAGSDESVTNGMTYSLRTDDKGNAYLYGIFSAGTTIKVKSDGITLRDFCFGPDTFKDGTVPGKSYVLNAIPSYPLSAYHYASLNDA
jgi:hypothetical protein